MEPQNACVLSILNREMCRGKIIYQNVLRTHLTRTDSYFIDDTSGYLRPKYKLLRPRYVFLKCNIKKATNQAQKTLMNLILR